MEHLYLHFENTSAWNILKEALEKLEENKDIKITTRKENVIGYLVKSLAEDGFDLK
jgi:hypothetical protein